MKIKLLIAILAVVVITLGVLLGIKAFTKSAEIIAQGTQAEGETLNNPQNELEKPKSK